MQCLHLVIEIQHWRATNNWLPSVENLGCAHACTSVMWNRIPGSLPFFCVHHWKTGRSPGTRLTIIHNSIYCGLPQPHTRGTFWFHLSSCILHTHTEKFRNHVTFDLIPLKVWLWWLLRKHMALINFRKPILTQSTSIIFITHTCTCTDNKHRWNRGCVLHFVLFVRAPDSVL